MAKAQKKGSPKVRLCIDMDAKAHKKLKIYSVTHERHMGVILSELINEFLTLLETQSAAEDQ